MPRVYNFKFLLYVTTLVSRSCHFVRGRHVEIRVAPYVRQVHLRYYLRGVHGYALRYFCTSQTANRETVERLYMYMT
uniref:Uncharacterized protein n=1 Tax=Hyaloperonospora arabidopsidis (strain Emoy2) TaxID=559515 RepID=M4BCX3_HYAAE